MGRNVMDVNERVTILCAVRYAMGRSSYAPGCVIDHIRANKHRISASELKKFIENIRQDYEERIRDFDSIPLGEEWLELIEFLEGGNDEE